MTTDDSRASLLMAVRDSMVSAGLDGLYIGRGDRFQGEEVRPCDEFLSWLTGFSGSAGAAIIMADTAAVFSDQRYTLQMARQLDSSLFTAHDVSVLSPMDWLAQHKQGARIGLNGWAVSKASYDKMAAHLATPQLVSLDDEFLAAHWQDRPDAAISPVWSLPPADAGQSVSDKLADLTDELSSHTHAACLITAPDAVNWLLNIRGRDLKYTPFHLCYALIGKHEHTGSAAITLIGADTSARQCADYLISFDDVANQCQDRGYQRLLCDAASLPLALYEQLSAAGLELIMRDEPSLARKARKNDAERAGFEAAHLADGVAMMRFWYWLAHIADRSTLTEADIADRLTEIRSGHPDYICDSFPTIAGMGGNGAIVHYRAEKGHDAGLADDGVLLLDSGAHYRYGTTDITRSFALGAVSEEAVQAATFVLAAHIELATARFPQGTTGAQLDAICRRPLWQAGLDFGHGTGHGVGHVLSVHEGPVSISKRSHRAVEAGHLLSNEPGYYKEGHFGIRLENLVITEPCHQHVRAGMLAFETITLCPFDRNLIAPSLLTEAHRNWLNSYHRTVAEKLSPHLEPEVADFLDQLTRPV